MCVCVCVCVFVSMMSPKRTKISHRAQFLLYRLFHSKNLFDLPDDAISTAAACFGEGLRSGGGVVFNVKWRRYKYNGVVFHVPHAPSNISSNLLTRPIFFHFLQYIIDGTVQS